MARKLIVAVLLAVAVLAVTGCKEKVAVLISTNNVITDDLGYHSVWWYDTVMMYDLLKNKGEYDRIYVLYGNGTDFNSKYKCYKAQDRFGQTITDFPCDRAHIEAVLKAVGQGGTVDGKTIAKLKENKKSRFFVWWMGHGGGSSSSNYVMEISHTGEHVTGQEFADWVNYTTNHGKRTTHVMTCHAGCYLPLFNTAGNRTVAEASSTCAESSYELLGSPDVNHAEYTYWLYCALRENQPGTSATCLGPAVPSDANSDGKVTYDESFTYISANMVRSTPQRQDPDGIAPTTYLRYHN